MDLSAQRRDLNAAREFFETVFDEGVPGHIAISTRHPKSRVPTTRFFTSNSDAAGYATAHAGMDDVYYRVTTLKRQPDRGRGKEGISLALPGLSADIDVGRSRDNNRNYPPDEASAIEVLKGLGIPLPMVVRSGGGLHPSWLTKQPLILDTPQDFAFAEAADKAWNAHLNDRFGRLGWEIDPPGGLSKLLRPPGTFNHKTLIPGRVELLPGPINRWASIECLFEDAGIALPTISNIEGASSTLGRAALEAALPPDAERCLLEDPVASRLLDGSLHTRQSASEDDLWLLIRAGAVGVDWKSYAFALMDRRRSASGEGWGIHTVEDYVRRTVRRAEEALLNPTQIPGPGPEGWWSYREDVVKKCWVARDMMIADGLNPTAICVLEAMCRWSKDGVTTAVAQSEIQKIFGWRSLQPVREAQQALQKTGWLRKLEEAKRGKAATFWLLLDPAFHTSLAS